MEFWWTKLKDHHPYNCPSGNKQDFSLILKNHQPTSTKLISFLGEGEIKLWKWMDIPFFKGTIVITENRKGPIIWLYFLYRTCSIKIINYLFPYFCRYKHFFQYTCILYSVNNVINESLTWLYSVIRINLKYSCSVFFQC